MPSTVTTKPRFVSGEVRRSTGAEPNMVEGASMTESAPALRIPPQRKVLLCMGPGGVGKTTVSAALGLAAAQAGRRVIVVTIDPSRRLAQALGLDAAQA